MLVIFGLCSCLIGISSRSENVKAPAKRLLVIAPKAFQPALQEFMVHKQRLLRAELLALETIAEGTPGSDDPEKLKHFLFDEWKDHGLDYVLLVGDVDVLPVRYMVLDRVTPAAFDYAFYPSDLYYADLAKPDGSFEDWNGRKEGFHARYFGEVRGEKNKEDPINFDAIDYKPEIAVGRWPVSTPEEARLVAQKTISFETTVVAGTSAYLHRAAFFSVGGWVDSRGFMDRLAQKFSPEWALEKRYYSTPNNPAATPPPNHDELRSILNSGVLLAVHTGHGQPNGWEQCFSLGDLQHLTNSAALPVVISAGCSTAYFAPLPPYEPYVDVKGVDHAGSDHKEVFAEPPPPPSPYQRGKFNPSGLGEQLLKRDANGAVAYIGCNTGSQPCALTLVDGFVGAWTAAKEPHLGEVWSQAISYYFDQEHLATLKPNNDWYPPSIFFQGMKFMLFGDPSLRLPGNSAPAKL